MNCVTSHGVLMRRQIHRIAFEKLSKNFVTKKNPANIFETPAPSLFGSPQAFNVPVDRRESEGE